MMWSPRTAALLSLLLAAFATGCGGSSDRKSKSTSGAPVSSGAQTIRLDSPDTDDPEFLYLKAHIEKRSHGALLVSVGADYPGADPANEVALVRAVRSGKRDFALVAAPAWPAAGVPALAALQAPFVLGTYEVARAALAGAAGASLLGALKRAGVVPLALVPTELRRLLATRALTRPSNFHGARVRIVDNAVAADVLRGLGARPRQGLTSDDVLPGLQSHRLDGAEIQPVSALDNDYWLGASHLTGYALFDKVWAFVASPGAFKRLSAANQAAVRAAAADTVRHAATLAAREHGEVATLCQKGVHLDVPTPAALRALARTEAPVLAALDRDPAAGPILRQLRATPGAGPRALAAPKDCAR
jgi:TRAP-type C4-dicarboxylate transport system substrate-binding protein